MFWSFEHNDINNRLEYLRGGVDHLKLHTSKLGQEGASKTFHTHMTA